MRLAVLLAVLLLPASGSAFAKSAALSICCERSGNTAENYPVSQKWREIVTAASPPPDAFWETGRRMRSVPGFLQDISEDMRRPDGKTLPAILEENTAVHLADTRFLQKKKRRAAGGRMRPWHCKSRHAEGEFTGMRHAFVVDRGTAERIAAKEEALSESWNHGRPFFIF